MSTWSNLSSLFGFESIGLIQMLLESRRYGYLRKFVLAYVIIDEISRPLVFSKKIQLQDFSSVHCAAWFRFDSRDIATWSSFLGIQEYVNSVPIPRLEAWCILLARMAYPLDSTFVYPQQINFRSFSYFQYLGSRHRCQVLPFVSVGSSLFN